MEVVCGAILFITVAGQNRAFYTGIFTGVLALGIYIQLIIGELLYQGGDAYLVLVLIPIYAGVLGVLLPIAIAWFITLVIRDRAYRLLIKWCVGAGLLLVVLYLIQSKQNVEMNNNRLKLKTEMALRDIQQEVWDKWSHAPATVSRLQPADIDTPLLYSLFSTDRSGFDCLALNRQWGEAGGLVDYWGRPFYVKAYAVTNTAEAKVFLHFKIWSSGPNKVNEFGQGDDISISFDESDVFKN